ncbi:MAG: hypothetical protein P8008_01270 [Gammaproteobacteria bacterium]
MSVDGKAQAIGLQPGGDARQLWTFTLRQEAPILAQDHPPPIPAQPRAPQTGFVHGDAAQ